MDYQDEKDDDRDEVPRDLQHYVQYHLTMCLGYAKAGAFAKSTLPETPEEMGSNSWMYGEVPLDVVLKFHERMEVAALELDPSVALD